MNFNNPFDSWVEAGQGSSSQNTPWNVGPSQAPSIFGALPYVSDPAHPNLISYYFTSFNPDILNCSTVYRIVTDNQNPGYTVIKDIEGKNVSLIEWQAHPLIESARSWLSLTSDKRSGSRNPMFLAKITRANGAVTLDMTPDAIQLGLLDVAVSAALLLQCGRNID
ncbi:hypothetical protein BJ912DRAFT_1032774 [Pholiota molesta]|nr:hypothetical protein BJ912DRAFT_1032774 [Pholiota molesta]